MWDNLKKTTKVIEGLEKVCLFCSAEINCMNVTGHSVTESQKFISYEENILSAAIPQSTRWVMKTNKHITST